MIQFVGKMDAHTRVLCGALLAGFAIGAAMSQVRQFRFGPDAAAARRKETARETEPTKPTEPTVDDAQALVGRSLSGAMQAAQLFVGDKLGLYARIRADDAKRKTTALQLAASTGLSQRWLRE